MHTDLTKKTTILFSPDLYEQLSIIATQRRSSVGELVRDACRSQYLLSTQTERMDVIRQLGELHLPVGTPEEMERESIEEYAAL